MLTSGFIIWGGCNPPLKALFWIKYLQKRKQSYATQHLHLKRCGQHLQAVHNQRESSWLRGHGFPAVSPSWALGVQGSPMKFVTRPLSVRKNTSTTYFEDSAWSWSPPPSVSLQASKSAMKGTESAAQAEIGFLLRWVLLLDTSSRHSCMNSVPPPTPGFN